MNKTFNVLLSLYLFLLIPSFSNAQLFIREGWPVLLENDWQVYSRHNLVTYELPSGQQIVGASTSGQIALYDIDGNPIQGWPLTWENYLQHGNILQGPRMGDMDGDGLPEIVVQTRTGSEDRIHRVLVYGLDGNLQPELSYEVQGEADFAPPNSCPVLVDINGDGTDELFHIFDSLYAIDGFGQPLTGFPWALNDTMVARLASPVIGAGEGWPHEEILVIWGTRSRIHARNLNSEVELPGWPIESPDEFYYSPITLIPIDIGWIITCIDRNFLYAWDQSGNSLPGFPVQNNISGSISNASYDVIAGDLDGDNEVDLLYRQASQYLMAYDLQAEPLAGFPVEIASNNGGAEPPVVLRTTDSDSAIIIDASACTDWHNRIIALRYNLRLPWYNIDLPISAPGTSLTEVAIIPRCTDTLTVAHFTHNGDLHVLDYPMNLVGAQIIWQMQGNNAGGNRMYEPQAPLGVKDTSKDIIPDTSEPVSIYPNPSNSSFNVRIKLPANGKTIIRFYNILGKELFIKELHGIPFTSMTYNWNGSGFKGEDISSGIYFVVCDQYPQKIKKAVLLQ